MIEQIKPIFKPISERQIEELEIECDISFPKEYKNFLLSNNGGFPKPNIFTISFSEGESIIDVFYGISDALQRKNLDLRYNIRNTRRSMLSEIIPIGTDPGGNYICLCVSGVNCGKVYFFDHEKPNEELELITWNNLIQISNSLNKFLEKLH